MAVRNESVRLTLEDAGFTTGMAKAAAATALLDRSLNDLDGTNVRTDRSTRGLSTDALPTLDRNVRTADRSINQLTGRLRLFADAAAVLGPALVPLGAAAVPALAAMTTQLGVLVAAGGTAALVFAGMGDAMGALNDYQLEPTAENLQAMRVEMEKVGPAAADFLRFIDSLEPSLRDLQMVAREGLLPGAEEGIGSLMERLPQVRSLVGDLATTMGRLASEAGAGLAGGGFDAFFEYLDAEAGPILSDFGRTLGNFGEGFANMIVGLGPLTSDFSGGLLEMSRSFAAWSQGIATSTGWQEFVGYVQQSGPQVLDLFGSLVDLFVQVAQAAAPIGAIVVPALTAMVDVIAALADSPLGTIFLSAAAGMAAYTRAASLVGAANARIASSTLSATTSMERMRATAAGLHGHWKGIAAGAGMVALSMTDLDDKAGISNTAMLGLAGSLAGPWGAAVGTGIGLTMDFAASNDTLTDSLAAVETALSNLSGNATASDFQAIGTQVKAAEANLVKLGDSLNNMDSFSDVMIGAKNAVEGLFGEDDYEEAYGRLQAAQAALDTAMSRSGQMAGFFGDAIGMTAQELNVASDAAGAFSGALAELGGWLDKREALRNYRAGIDELRAGLKESFSPETAGQIDAVGRNIMAVASQIKDKSLRADFLQGARKSLEDLANNAGPKGQRAVERLIGKLDELGLTRPKPKVDVDTQAATAKTQAVQRLVDKYGMTRAEARALLNDLATAGINRVRGNLTSLDGKTATTTVTNKIVTVYETRGNRGLGGGNFDNSLGGLVPQADGGSVPKTGLPYADRHPYLLADGEEVISNRNRQADMYRPVLKAINADLPRHIIKGMLAEGGTVGRLASGGTARPVMGWQGDLTWVTAAQAAGYALADTFGNLANLNKRERRELEQRMKTRERVAQRELKMAEDMLSARKDELKALRDSRRAMKEQVAGNFMSDVFGDIDITTAAREGLVRSSVMQQVHAWGQAQQQAGVEMDGNPSDWIEAYLATLPRDQRDAIVNGVRGNMLNRNTLEAERFQSALEQLRKLGLDGGAFQALAESGNLSAAQFYASQSREQIDQFEQQFNTRGATALGLGNMAAGAQFDKSIKVAEQMRDDAREARREAAENARKAERLLSSVEKRLERIERESPKKTGEEVGKAVNGAVKHGQRSGK